jgi:hypothetical protein
VKRPIDLAGPDTRQDSFGDLVVHRPPPGLSGYRLVERLAFARRQETRGVHGVANHDA